MRDEERTINHPKIQRRVTMAATWRESAQSWGRGSPRNARLCQIRQTGVAKSTSFAFAALRAGLDPDVPGEGTDAVDAAARKIGDLVTAGSFDDARAAIPELASALKAAATAIGADPKTAEDLISTLDLACQRKDGEEATTTLDALLEVVSLPPLSEPAPAKKRAPAEPMVALSARAPRIAGRYGRATFAAGLPPDTSAQLDPMMALGAALSQLVAAHEAGDIIKPKLLRAVKDAADAYVEIAPESEADVDTLIDAVTLHVTGPGDSKKALAAIAAFAEATGIQVEMKQTAALAAALRRTATRGSKGEAFGAGIDARRR